MNLAGRGSRHQNERARRTGTALGLLALVPAVAAAAGTPPLAELRARWVESSVALAEGEVVAGRPDNAQQVTTAARTALTSLTPVDTARLDLAEAEIALYRTYLFGPPYDDAESRLRTALRGAEVIADRALVARARDQLALALFLRNFRASEHAEARALLESALTTRRALADHRGVAESLFHLGLTHEHCKDPRPADTERARQLYDESLAEATAYGFSYEASYPVRHLAGMAQDRGDLAAARAGLERSLALRREAGALLVVTPALTALADVLAEQGELERARELYEEGVRVARSLGSPKHEAEAQGGLARLAGRPR